MPAPYDAACGAIEPAYEALIGLQVGPGYRSEVRKRIGGRAVCTHMTELASALGPAVVQALAIDVPAPPDKRPFSLDGCHALATTGSLVAIHFPRCYRDPTADGAQAHQTPRHRAASDSENAEGDKTP